jgi:regulator of PEP synthase PpsR (kinase-PPPase family)
MDSGVKEMASPAHIYIVSGGAGTSGEQLVHTVLAQFPDSEVTVITAAHVRQPEQLEDIVAQAADTRGIIVHTLVDACLRDTLTNLAADRELVSLDLMHDLLDHVSAMLARKPIGQPGLYRQLNRDYFERVEAIEFTMAHDDGSNPQGWPLAEIVLAGVSRVGKTPLSMYLAVLGWRVANVSLVAELAVPPELFKLDPRRVIGLSIEPGQLLAHRQQRQRQLGTLGTSAYTEPAKVFEEVEATNRILKRSGFSVLDITDKPIETSADAIIKLITRRTKTKKPRSTQLSGTQNL